MLSQEEHHFCMIGTRAVGRQREGDLWNDGRGGAPEPGWHPTRGPHRYPGGHHLYVGADDDRLRGPGGQRRYEHSVS